MNLIKRWIFVLAAAAGVAAWADDLSSAQRAADRIAAAMVDKDFASVAELTHPRVVAQVGGAAALAKRLDTAYAGLTVKSMKFARPEQIQDVRGTLIGVFRFREKILVRSQIVEVNSFYIGFAAGKNNWKFIDCDGVTQHYLAALLPGYANNLDLNGC